MNVATDHNQRDVDDRPMTATYVAVLVVEAVVLVGLWAFGAYFG